MTSSTYTTKVIVLRKTKLGETDLILTLLAEDGSQIRAVAKGARKPSSTFASRLELYSSAEILCSKGKSLDIIKEARLLDGNERLRSEIEYSAGAAPMVELLDKITQTGLEATKYFDMTLVAMKTLSQVEYQVIPSITAAHLLKVLAFSGLRPSLVLCVACGKGIDPANKEELIHLSYREGGVLCEACGAREDTLLTHAGTIQWANYLLCNSFSEIAKRQMHTSDAFQVLQFCQSWIREHVGINLKSLKFMFTGGLYQD